MSIWNRMNGSNDDAQQMDRIQAAVIQALGPFKGTTEAVLMAGALLRVARMLIYLYGRELRGGFIDASIAFLRGQGTLPDARENDLRKLGFRAPDERKN